MTKREEYEPARTWTEELSGHAESVRKRTIDPFGTELGINLTEVSPDRVVGEMPIRDELRTFGNTLHGGAIMAFADTLGAMATIVNLKPGQGTTTLESKTNFFAAARQGKVIGESTPLHRGKSTQVWQTRITDETGRLVAQVIQTQMVLKIDH